MKLQNDLNQIKLSRVSEPFKQQGNSESPTNQFGAMMSEAVTKLNAAAVDADQKSEGFLNGEVGIHELMVGLEKFDMMLQLGSSVRSKALEAYQKLMNSAGA